MAGTNPRPGSQDNTPSAPDFSAMSADELAGFIAAANEARAAKEQAELAERRKEAMQGLKQSLVDISAAVTRAGTAGIEAGDFQVLASSLTDVISLAQTARKTAVEAGRQAGVKVTRSTGNGNGSQRSSDLRDELLAVINGSPDGTEWTASQLSHEVSPSPQTGNPRSTGLIGNHLVSMAEHGQIRQVSDSPKKYAANVAE